MQYPEFVKELVRRFGEERGVPMALRAEVGFLRTFLEEKYKDEFLKEQADMIEDFLNRHPEEAERSR